MTTMTTCPECSGELATQDATQLGELVDCSACGSELEITGLAPLSLVLAPEVEEDWGE